MTTPKTSAMVYVGQAKWEKVFIINVSWNGGRENSIADDEERDSREAGDAPSFFLQLRIMQPMAVLTGMA